MIKTTRPLFTSDRERRLWFWAAVVQTAIYSTLGLGGKLVDVLRGADLLGALFGLGFAVVLVVIITQGLQIKPKGVEIAVGLGVTAACLMIFVRMGIPAVERTHLFEYGVVAVFIYQALLERAHNGRRVSAPGLIAVVVTALLGWVDEGIQAVLPNWVYDLRDVGANALAGLMAVFASMVLAWVQRRRSK